MIKSINPLVKRTVGFFSVIFIVVLVVICVFESNVYTKPNDIQDDINNKYTNVGNIQMTVTNYGTIGKGYCGTQPSCMYPKGSGIENLWLGGLWFGGIKNGQIRVTTGAIDVSNANKQEGFEFTNGPGSIILEKSSLITSPYYDPKAISHQDFVCEFFDTITTGIQNHNPIGIKVLLESYTYNLNFANSFVILNYKIVNVGYNGDTSPIDSVYVGLWKDCVVRNQNVSPGCSGVGTSYYSHGATGYIDTMRMEYTYDYDGDVGFTDSYCGIKLLGASPKPLIDTVKSKFTIWQFKNTGDPFYFSPTTDDARYSKMKGFLAPGTPIDSNRINYLRLHPANRVTLISYGPYKKTDGTPLSLRYQLDTINVVFSIICAKKNGTDPASMDTDFQRQTLYKNAGWAQRAYDNGYKLPSPPDIPITRAEIDEHKVTLWWTNNAENSVDPISGKKDFEGYRIYRTNAGADLTNNFDLSTALKLIGDFDSCCNAYGNNTGFKFIKYDTIPKTFPGDANKYWYRFEFPNQLNGFQYIYSVTSYDKGDPTQGLESLESSLLANVKRIIVGTAPKDNSSAEIGVYPNPYYGSAIWDGPGTQKEVLRKIYFFNLPSKCDINIWSLSGDLVQTLHHDASTYNGNDIQWFNTYSDGTQKFAGGEHAWDLISKDYQAIATGLYLFTVKDAATGDIKKGKFLIVK